MTVESFDLQPTLTGPSLLLRPLKPDDFEALYLAASDPQIWEQHPSSDRYQKPVFDKFFEGALRSGGAFVVIDRFHGHVVGSTRFYDWKPELAQITIGYTFLERAYWGGEFNREMKSLMLDHAFERVGKVTFEIGKSNARSRRAIEKIGARLLEETILDGKPYVIYGIGRGERR